MSSSILKMKLSALSGESFKREDSESQCRTIVFEIFFLFLK